MSETIKTSDSLMQRFSGWLGYLFFLCVGIMGVEVVARYIFNAPTIWVHELSVILIGVNFALGGIFVLYDRAHISITVAYELSSPFVRKILDVFTTLVSAGYLIVLTYASWVITTQSWKLFERSGTAWNPPLPMILKTALFVSATAMAIVAVLQFASAIRRLGISDK